MTDALVISNLVLWVAVLALLVALIALSRQIGILYERIAPMGALMMDTGPKVGEVAPVFIDAQAVPGAGYPVGGLTVVAFRNAHLVYALTWFGLAGLSLAGAAIVWRSGAASQGQAARTPAV